MHDEETGYERPFNAVPPAVLALAAVIVGIEIVFQLGRLGIIGGPSAVGWRLGAMEEYGFFDMVFEAMRAQGHWPLEHLRRFVSYAFVHVSLTHAVIAAVFILALGKMVGESFGNFAVVLIFFLASAVGALAYGLLSSNAMPLLGAYPAAYGLIGAYTFILWLGLRHMQENQLQAFRLIGFLMGVQLLFALLFGGGPDWIGDFAGFVTGFVTAALLVPGSIGRILARLRAR